MLRGIKKATPLGEIEILDAHAHFFSHRFFQTLASQSNELKQLENPFEKIAEKTGWEMPSPDPVDLATRWQAELDRHSVSAALLIASVPGDEESVAKAIAAFPDRFRGGFFFDPTQPTAEQRARRAFNDLGLSVACLFPAMHSYSVSDCEGANIVAAIASEKPGRAVFVHCGALSVGVRKKLDLPCHFDLTKSSPLDLHKLAKRYPNTKFIIPHFGAGLFRETLMVADLCPNIYLDTSGTNQWIKYDPSLTNLTQIFRRAIEVVGYDRLLFGTDSSFFPRGWNASVLEAQINSLLEIKADDKQVASVLGANLRSLVA
ncbi:MAG TPA: amidohydrolase family protein [Blastocatellia bacterium]|nr:amidohydrolase family protein [Blastocatellia bacterium]